MKIGFRLDANKNVASGHMMRCIAVARELLQLENEVYFFCIESEYINLLHSNNIGWVDFKGHWDDWDSDVELMIQMSKKYDLDLLVVDSYLAQPFFLSEVNKTVPVFMFDDLCEEKYEVTAVLHYSQWEEELTLENLYGSSNVKLFSGMKYIPLRQEFKNVKKKIYSNNTILITTGGTDPYHISLELVKEFITDKRYREYFFYVICGKYNNDWEEILKLSQRDNRIIVKRDVKNMAQVMNSCSFAISAGGMTIYELGAMGLPIVGIAFSDDHDLLLKKMHQYGMLKYAGDMRKELCINRAINYLFEIISHDDMKTHMVAEMTRIIDGKGAERIARVIMDLIEDDKNNRYLNSLK